MPFGETITALATPAGESAIALVRVSGPLVPELVGSVFSNHEPKPRTAVLGRYLDRSNQVVDQVLYTFFPEYTSYTGEELLEICCHGNPLIVYKIKEDLLARGCRLAEGGEFTKTAFLNRKMDLSQAEAVCDLIRARSEKALQAAQAQLAGCIGEKINAYIDRLLQVIAECEAYIDFPEEDLPAENQIGPVRNIALLIQEFEELILTHEYKPLLQEGIKTLIIGPPNSGKSSLLNTLLGEERSIVTPIPGTTRDLVAEQVMLGAYSIRLMDTAGLRETDEVVEKIGIEKTLQKISQADFFLFVVDASLSAQAELPPKVLECLVKEKTLVVENKIDLLADKAPFKLESLLPGYDRYHLSLKTQEGVCGFRDCLVEKFDALVPRNASEAGLVVNARHAHSLKKAVTFLHEAKIILLEKKPAEIASSELRGALGALEEIVGHISNERVLDKLFATFCIGK